MTPRPGAYIAIDPGQRGAAARIVVGAAGTVTDCEIAHAQDFHGRVLRVQAALDVLEVLGARDADGAALEALGLRPGEGVRATATAAASHAAWVAALDLARGPGRWRLVQPQAWGARAGLPAGLPRPLRKAVAIAEARRLVGDGPLSRGRAGPSDGAADAVLMALALARGF